MQQKVLQSHSGHKVSASPDTSLFQDLISVKSAKEHKFLSKIPCKGEDTEIKNINNYNNNESKKIFPPN